MVSNQKESLKEEVVDVDANGEDVNLYRALKTIIRNKRLVFVAALSGLMLFGFHKSYISKRIYEGEFQIFMELKEGNLGFRMPTFAEDMLSGETGPGTSNKLNTQQEILKSPSVLLNIFEHVQKKKGQKLIYKSWSSNQLNVKLMRGTSIINVRYSDTDQDLVLDVLDRISNAFQDYSGRKREKDIRLGLDYFEEQIAIFEERSKKSISLLQKYAMDENLAMATKSVLPSTDYITQLTMPQMNEPIPLSIESNRVAYSNQIRIINEQLNQIKKLSGNSERILFIAKSKMLPGEPIFSEVDSLSINQDNLSEARITYRDNDKNIQDLLNHRSILLKSLKNKVEVYLQTRKMQSQILLDAAKRPKGVLVKYRQLLSDSRRDTATLHVLENQYRELLLEDARPKDPWELITKPALVPIDYGSQLISFSFLGMIIGVVSGCSIALVNEKIKDVVFLTEEIVGLIEWPLIAELFVNQKQSVEETLSLINSGTLKDVDGSIAFISIGNIANATLNQFNQYLNKCLNGREFIITDDFLQATKCSNLILVTALGITKNQEILHAKTKVKMQNTPVLGFLSINDAIQKD